MKIPRPYSLQSKFLFGLTGSLLFVSAIIITFLYYFIQKTLHEEVNVKATIILQQVDAVQSYVRQSLRPKMYDLLADTFVVEAMSTSYISRSIMEKNSGQEAEYIYRRVAINARNPEFEANDTELELVRYFRENETESLWKGYRNINGLQVFVMARPVQFSSNCMHCHGELKDAPPELIAKYGNRGFGHDVNSIDGIDLVGIPTQRYATQNTSRLMFYVFSYLAASALVLFVTYLIFRQVVIVNFKTLTTHFRKNFRDKKGMELLRRVEHGDEIEEMIEGMEGLSQHLFETEQQLKQYNADLELEVTKRTDQLSLDSSNHKRDLALFVSILRSLRGSQNRPQLWATVLPMLGERFELVNAVYICTFSSNQTFAWPSGEEEHRLPDDYVDMLVDPKVRIMGNAAYVPVGSSADTIDGLLYLEKRDSEAFPTDKVELMMAIGRQLGIAGENLAALDSILRQTKDLQAIVDGIGDPLLLLDRNAALILANEAAGTLAGQLDCEDSSCLLSFFLTSLCADGQQLDAKQLRSVPTNHELLLDNGRSFGIHSIPLPAEESGGDRIIVIISESTEKKKMQQQVVRSEKMATVGKLAAGLAHELNNPMGVILCYAELLQKTILDPVQRNDVEVVIKHTKQAQAVLLDLLNFSRPKVVTNRQTNIGEVVGGVISVFQVQAAKKGVTLTFGCEENLPQVLVEPQVVEHIALNLLLNGLDAVPENQGEITVEICSGKGRQTVVMTMQDNGHGISHDVLPFIFDPFFTTKEVNEGTGLGLAVVYGYLDELGGKIEVTKTSKEGTVFEVVFPVNSCNMREG